MLFGLALTLGLAGPPGVQTRWDAPAACPQLEDAAARLGVLLGSWSPSAGAQHHVEGTAAETSSGFAVTIAVSTPLGETARVVEAIDCASATEGALVIAAIAIAPLSSMDPEYPEPRAAPLRKLPPASSPESATQSPSYAVPAETSPQPVPIESSRPLRPSPDRPASRLRGFAG